ncbi:MAG: ATP-binding protein, partial [Pseudomonadota bacterium]
MSAFVVHDLKTLVAQLSLLSANAERHKNNPAFIDDMFNTVSHSVEKMNGLLQKLRDSKEQQTQTQEKLAVVNLADMLADVIKMRKNDQPVPSLEIMDKDVSVSADVEQLATVIGHIVKNAQEATPRDGYVQIKTGLSGKRALICVEDNGSGMSETFVRERLFQPFESTKGLAGMGIGVYQCREYIQKLGGEIKVTSELNKGTYFEMSIPMIESNTETNV